MNKIYLFFAVMLLYVIGSCKSNIEVPIDQFKSIDSASLRGEPIVLANDSVLYDPRTLQVFDTIGIAYDNNGTSAYSVVNMKTGKLIKRFAFTGDGEPKFNINSLVLNRINKDNHHFTLLETSPPFKLFKYDLDSLLKDDLYKPSLVYQFPNGVIFSSLEMSNDSLIVGRQDFSRFDTKMLGFLNPRKNQLHTAVDLPRTNDSAYNEFYAKENISWTKSVFNGNIAIRPGGNKVAYFSEKGALIQIIEMKGNNQYITDYAKLYYFPSFKIVDYGNNTFKSKLTKECKYGFNSIAVTSDKIYALYNGKFTETDDINALSSSTIFVYDWNGAPLQKIKLDRACYQIAIDPLQPNLLFALNSFKNIGITKYKLK